MAYARPNFPILTLEDNGLADNLPLDFGLHVLNPQHDMGVLDRLPLELWTMILVDLDLRTLMDFRRINQRAMQVVDSLPLLQSIVRHGLNALRALLAVETAARVTCRELYRALGEPGCQRCGGFVGLIHLLDCTKVCYLCFARQEEYSLSTDVEAGSRFGLGEEDVARLLTMRSVPGRYAPMTFPFYDRHVLVRTECARRLGKEVHGSKAVERSSSWSSGEYAMRFMAVVQAPWVDHSTGTEEWGFHCVGCEKRFSGRPCENMRKFTSASFGEHLCEFGRIDIFTGVHQPVVKD